MSDRKKENRNLAIGENGIKHESVKNQPMFKLPIKLSLDWVSLRSVLMTCFENDNLRKADSEGYATFRMPSDC